MVGIENIDLVSIYTGTLILHRVNDTADLDAGSDGKKGQICGDRVICLGNGTGIGEPVTL